MAENRPLVVINNEEVLDETVKLATAVGCHLERLPDLSALRFRWSRAPLIVVDEQAVDAEISLPRRPNVLLIKTGPPDSETWRRAFAIGAEQVISLPEDEGDLVTALAEVTRPTDSASGSVLAVLGGRGGGGASVLAGSAGFYAARTGSALLLDCDPLGGGLDLLLGAELDTACYWPSREEEGEFLTSRRYLDTAHNARVRHQPVLISCDRAGHPPSERAVTSVIDTAVRAGQLVICDLPRQMGEVSAAVLGVADLIVVVVPAEVRACLAARSLIDSLPQGSDRVRLVVRGPAPDGLRAHHIAESIESELLVAMAAERGLARSVERGRFPIRTRGPLASAAAVVVEQTRTAARTKVAQ